MISSRPYRLLAATISKRLKAIAGSGLSPGKLALTVCIGSAVGILPLPWGTTLLCVLLGYLFKLNHVVLQSLNYLFYPLQLALLIPYCKLGSRLFPWGPPLPPVTLASLFHRHISDTLNLFGWAILKALAAWLITAPPAALLLYLVLLMVIRKRSLNKKSEVKCPVPTPILPL